MKQPAPVDPPACRLAQAWLVLCVLALACSFVGCVAPHVSPESAATQPGHAGSPWQGIFELALMLAAEDRPGLDLEASRRELERLAESLRTEQRGDTAAERVARTLFEVNGFRSAPNDPQGLERQTFDVDRVLATRRGTCLAITVIALAACERAGIRAVPLLSQDHAALLVEPGLVLDPALGGVRLGPEAPPGANALGPVGLRPVEPDALAAALLANRATYRRAEGDFEDARLDLERALELDPQSVTARINHAVVLLDEGKTERAREELEGLEREGLGTALTAYNLGVAAAREKLFGVARHWYALALEREPKLTAAHVNLGATLLALGELGAAREHFAAALALEPDNPSARRGLSACDEATATERKDVLRR